MNSSQLILGSIRRFATVERIMRVVFALAFFPAWGGIAFLIAIAGAEWNVPILKVLAAVLAGSSFASCIFLVGHALFMRMQWRLLELLITVIAGTLPMAYMIRVEHLTVNNLGTRSIISILLTLIAGLWISFTASVIGTGCANDFGENRAMHRLGIVLLVWGALLSVGGGSASFVVLASILCGEHVIFGSYNRENWQYFILLSSTLLVWLPILMVNRHYRTRGGVNVQR